MAQRLSKIFLRFSIVLAVQHPEIQPQQRHGENPGRRLRRQALAATLYAEQQHAARGVHYLIRVSEKKLPPRVRTGETDLVART